MARRHWRPFVKTVAYTLAASSEILARDAVGTLTPARVDDIIRAWTQRVFAAGRGTLAGFGAERIDTSRAYVVMTNHQSLLDIPSVVGTFPARIRFVAKRELAQVPVWGHAMKVSGNVIVDRGNREKAIAALERGKAELQKGTSIWIAPEGTRSRTGELGPFKKGGFHLALDLQAPILPAWIDGTRHIVAPDSFGVNLHGRVTVEWGDPIETAGRGPDDMPQLLKDVRAALLALKARAAARAAAQIH